MRIRRDISSIPFRTANETWDRIVKLITGAGSIDLAQLQAAAAVVASVIADELMSEVPLLVEGCGPQLRIYCRYGVDASTAGDDLDPINWNPTAGDWTMRVPCDAENLDWVRKALAKCSSRLKPFDVANGDKAEDAATVAAISTEKIVVDWSVKD
jgi:hypothetical protein